MNNNRAIPILDSQHCCENIGVGGQNRLKRRTGEVYLWGYQIGLNEYDEPQHVHYMVHLPGKILNDARQAVELAESKSITYPCLNGPLQSSAS